MLKTRYIKIKVTHLDQDRYFISADNEEGQFFFPSTWQYLLFNHHEESFFGTMVDVENDRWSRRHCVKWLAASDPISPRAI